HPKVFALSGAVQPFSLTLQGEQTASLDRFLEPLQVLEAAAGSTAIQPDFLVFTISSAVIHELALKQFTSTIFKLLELEYTIHLKKLSFSDYNIPQDRTIIVLQASPFHTD